jgi:phage protein D
MPVQAMWTAEEAESIKLSLSENRGFAADATTTAGDRGEPYERVVITPT